MVTQFGRSTSSEEREVSEQSADGERRIIKKRVEVVMGRVRVFCYRGRWIRGGVAARAFLILVSGGSLSLGSPQAQKSRKSANNVQTVRGGRLERTGGSRRALFVSLAAMVVVSGQGLQIVPLGAF